MLRTTCHRCGKLIPYGTDCPCLVQDKRKRDQDKRKRDRVYDATVRRKRDARLTAFYHSAEWRAMRPYIIAKYLGLDVYAYLVKHEIAPATVVHHIEPLREMWDLRLDEGNLIPLNAQSHAEIEMMYKTNKKRETQALLVQLLKGWGEYFDT